MAGQSTTSRRNDAGHIFSRDYSLYSAIIGRHYGNGRLSNATLSGNWGVIALVTLVLIQAAQIRVPPAIQYMADVNVLVGSCERHLPRRFVAQLDAVVRDDPAARRAVAQWREEGRRARAAQPHLYTRRICLRLVEAIGTY